MKYIVLTKERVKLLKGRQFAPDSIFGIFVDDFGNMCITDFEADKVTDDEFAWLADLPRVDPESLSEDNISEEEYIAREIKAAQDRIDILSAAMAQVKESATSIEIKK